MTQYRDDAAAARLRIETLEAQLGERDASLRAREAELREAEARAAASAETHDEQERNEARRALAAGQAAFLGVMVCLVVCASIFPLLWGVSCKRPPPFNVVGAQSPRSFGDRGAWSRASVDDVRALGALCQRVGDTVCADAAAELERQKLHAQPRVGASAR